MLNVLLVVHLFVAIALVAVVLLQRSEGGALGIGGSGGGMGGFLSGRSTANLLTRTTSILAAIFIINSLVLTKLSGTRERVQIPIEAPASEAPGLAVPAPATLPTGTPPAGALSTGTSAPAPDTPPPPAAPAAAPPGREPAPPLAR
jgi:preprotein translocase subunit SecG